MPKAVTLGTKLLVEDPATPGSFIAVGNLTSLPVPGPDKPEIDVTDFDSTGAEFLPGLPDNGTLDFSGFYNEDDAGQTILFDDANDTDAPTRTFRVEFTNIATRFEFDGYVARFRPTAGGVRDAYTFDGSIRVSGAVTRSTIV